MINNQEKNNSQCKLIREALERGEVLTWKDIYERFGCKNHGARISQLRQQGLPIPCNQLVTIDTKFGEKQIGIYYLKTLHSFIEAVKKRFPNSQGVHSRDEKGRFSGQISPETIHEQILPSARKRYEDGKESVRKIAKDMGIPWTTLYKKLRLAGVKMRHPGQQAKQAELIYE